MKANQLFVYYQGMPLGVRLHIAGRWRLFPFPALLDYVSVDGCLLDVGCGYGLWCFLVAEELGIPVSGIDPDPKKIEIARLITDKYSSNQIRFDLGDMQLIGNQQCATISIIDVMYLIPHEQQHAIIQKAWNCLQPGGRLLVKEMGSSRKWKFALNWLEEFIAVRLLRITMGKRFYFRTESEWESLLASQGFKTRRVYLDAGYLHPHVLFVGEKP